MMIVKVQISPNDSPYAVVCASGGERSRRQLLSDDVLQQMDGAEVAFFNAEWVNGAWRLGTRVTFQGW